MTRPTSHVTGLYLITGVCGFVDAACFLSLGGVFAEIMTGNLLFLCFSLGTGQPIGEIRKYVFALLAFAVGAAAGGRLLRGRWQETLFGFATEWALLVSALLATLALDPGPDGMARDVVVSLLAFAMGLQNALIRRHGVPDLATNVMTLQAAATMMETPAQLGGDFPRECDGRSGADDLCRCVGAARDRRRPVYAGSRRHRPAALRPALETAAVRRQRPVGLAGRNPSRVPPVPV